MFSAILPLQANDDQQLLSNIHLECNPQRVCDKGDQKLSPLQNDGVFFNRDCRSLIHFNFAIAITVYQTPFQTPTMTMEASSISATKDIHLEATSS